MRLTRTSRHLFPSASILALACASAPLAGADSPLPGTLKPTKGAPQPSSNFLNYVYRYADARIKNGRDTYGPDKTPLFLSALDRQTLEPLKTRPPAPTGVSEDERLGPSDGPLTGANPMYDETFSRLLRILRGLSQNAAYTEAANDLNRWVLAHPLPDSGLLPWGRGMGWDVVSDKPFGNLDHGYIWPHPWLMWDQCYQPAIDESKRPKNEPRDCSCFGLVPEESKNFATALLKYRSEHKTAHNDLRQMGFELRTWAAAYARTRDQQFLAAVKTTLSSMGDVHVIGLPALGSRLSAGIDCYGASLDVAEPLASRLRAFAARQDQEACADSSKLKEKGGFMIPYQSDADAGHKREEKFTPLWDPSVAHQTTAALAMMCVARYENGGNVCLKKIIIDAAEAYLKSPPPEDMDLWPLTVGQVISLETAAWRATADRKYFDHARELGQFAVKAFWGDSSLPRASLRSEHYENLTGADTLATALLELHLSILHITAVPHPANTADR